MSFIVIFPLIVSIIISTTNVLSLTDSDDPPPNIILFFIDDMEFTQSMQMFAPTGYTYFDLPTPNINAFMNESVLFRTSYCGAPKCTPSRFSLLTGRQASRSEWAIAKAVREGTAYFGARVEVVTSKLSFNDSYYNMPYVLQNDVNNSYYTGVVGKWHLSHNPTYSSLGSVPDETLYTQLTNSVKKQGFDFVDALYAGNIEDNGNFSHNPEWMLSQSQRFIETAVNEEQKPFLLYFASTLTHVPSAVDAVLSYSDTDTPKGELDEDDIPSDTAMMDRESIYEQVISLVPNATLQDDEDTAVADYWIDDCFGALIDFLKAKDLYDNTFIVLMTDQGMSTKGLLYQGGSRVFQYVRYPPLFSDNAPYIIPSDFIVSFTDLAPTIFELTGIEPPNEYLLDGKSWLTDVQNYILNNETEQTCCGYRYIDMEYSHSIVTAQYQYIYRKNHTYKGSGPSIESYPYYNDEEQLYDLTLDPTQQINVINDTSIGSVINTFQQLMREYIEDICAIDECKMPNVSIFPTIAPSMMPTLTTILTATPITTPPSPITTEVTPPSPTLDLWIYIVICVCVLLLGIAIGIVIGCTCKGKGKKSEIVHASLAEDKVPLQSEEIELTHKVMHTGDYESI